MNPDEAFLCPHLNAKIYRRVCVSRQFAVRRGKSAVGRSGVVAKWKYAQHPFCAIHCKLGRAVAEQLPRLTRKRRRPKDRPGSRSPAKVIRDNLRHGKRDSYGKVTDDAPDSTTLIHDALVDEDTRRMADINRQIREATICRGCHGRIVEGESNSGFCPAPKCQRVREAEKQAIREGRAIPLLYRPVTVMAGHRASPEPAAGSQLAAVAPFPRSLPRRSEGADRGNPSPRENE